MPLRDLIGRLFKRGQDTLDAQAAAQAAKDAAERERRRLERITLPERDALEVSFILDGEGRPMESAAIGKSTGGYRRVRASVVNLSYRGLCARFRKPEHLRGFQRDVNCGFYMELDDHPVESRCRVAWVAGDNVGIQFLGLSVEAKAIVNHYLSPRFLGVSMREITAAQLKVDQPDLRLRWFQGKDNTNLLSWETKERDVIRQRFVFTDYVVHWEKDRPLRTGEMAEESAGNSFQRYARLAEDTVVFYEVPSAEIVQLGEAILHASQIDPDIVKPLLDRMSEAERRVGDRHDLRAGEVVEFRFLPDGGGSIACRAEEIGLGGLRALLPTARSEFPYWKHSKARGVLAIQGAEFEVAQVRVAELTDQKVHLEFVQIPREATMRLREMLEA